MVIRANTTARIAVETVCVRKKTVHVFTRRAKLGSMDKDVALLVPRTASPAQTLTTATIAMMVGMGANVQHVVLFSVYHATQRTAVDVNLGDMVIRARTLAHIAVGAAFVGRRMAYVMRAFARLGFTAQNATQLVPKTASLVHLQVTVISVTMAGMEQHVVCNAQNSASRAVQILHVTRVFLKDSVTLASMSVCTVVEMVFVHSQMAHVFKTSVNLVFMVLSATALVLRTVSHVRMLPRATHVPLVGMEPTAPINVPRNVHHAAQIHLVTTVSQGGSECFASTIAHAAVETVYVGNRMAHALKRNAHPDTTENNVTNPAPQTV